MCILQLLRDAVHLKKLLLVKLESERESLTSEFFNNCGSEGEVLYSDVVSESDENELRRQVDRKRRETLSIFKSQKIQLCTEIIGPYCGRFNYQEEFDLHQKHWHRSGSFVYSYSQPVVLALKIIDDIDASD